MSVAIKFGKNFLVFLIIYYYFNEVLKYWAPIINKCIVNLWKLTAYLQSTSINYPGFKFSKHLHFFEISALQNLCPCATFLTQLVETHIDRCMSI